MDSLHSKHFCGVCGREVIIDMGSIGTPHQFILAVTCAECALKPSKDRIPRCGACGKQMEHAPDPISGKLSEYTWVCPCNPGQYISIG